MWNRSARNDAPEATRRLDRSIRKVSVRQLDRRMSQCTGRREDPVFFDDQTPEHFSQNMVVKRVAGRRRW